MVRGPEHESRLWSGRAQRPRPEDLLAGCDAEQVEAITTSASPLCVLAGAGSGKTRVLTRRIAWHILHGSILGAHVLTLTFTRKAASEMRARLTALGQPEGVTAGTFHAIALAELRRLAAERGQLPPVVLSSKARILHDVVEELGYTNKLAPRRQWQRAATGRATSSAYPPIHDIAAEIEWAKSRLISPFDYETRASLARRQPPVDLGAVARIFEGYETQRGRKRVLDFEDLLTTCSAELASDAEFSASARWRFRHVFVDEYQDVNAAQLNLLRQWCGGSADLCVVGDPDQAIYAWNGSDPEAINRFAEHFPGAKVIRLSANYRSTNEVLNIATAVLGRVDVPRVGGPMQEGPIPTLDSYEDGEAEASAIAELARLAHRPGRRWSQIAVLARTNAQLTSFQQAFERLGVPCRSLGDSLFLRRGPAAAALQDLFRAPNATALALQAADLRTAAQESRNGEAEDEETEAAPPPEASDLLELASLVEEYLRTDAVATGAGLRAFVETAARAGGTTTPADAVELVTFHRAKGLEWPVVFVTGLEDGLVPIAHAKDEAALAEERRLLYVACTRAEEELHCSWARERKFSSERASARQPSPYLAAIERAQQRLVRRSSRSVPAAREALAASRRALAQHPPR